MKVLIRSHGRGPHRDEGGPYELVEADGPDQAAELARRFCPGCRDDFYNFRRNMAGSMCWSLAEVEKWAEKGSKGAGDRPPCYRPQRRC